MPLSTKESKQVQLNSQRSLIKFREGEEEEVIFNGLAPHPGETVAVFLVVSWKGR